MHKLCWTNESKYATVRYEYVTVLNLEVNGILKCFVPEFGRQAPMFRRNLSIHLQSVICKLNFLNNFQCTIIEFKVLFYEGWNFNSGNYLFTTDTK